MIPGSRPVVESATDPAVPLASLPHPLLLLHWIVCTGGVGATIVLWFVVAGALRRRAAPPRLVSPPPLTILKPFDGLDPQLERNFEATVAVPWPAEVQVLFCTDRDNSAGIEVARRAAAGAEGLPTVEAEVLLNEPGEAPPGASRKTWHLQRGLARARYDVLILSDSTTRLDEVALRHAVATLAAEPSLGAAWVSYTVQRGRGLGALLARVAFTATAFSFAVVDAVRSRRGGPPLLVGGLVAIRRSALEAIGGFEPFGDYITEDLPMARALVEAGHGIRRAPGLVERCLEGEGVAAHFSRLRRWNAAMMAFGEPGRVHYPLAQTPLALSAVTLPLALIAASEDWSTAAILSAVLLATRLVWSFWILARANRRPPSLSLLWGVPLNEGVMLAAFVSALFARTQRWRGQRFRLLRGGRVQRIDP